MTAVSHLDLIFRTAAAITTGAALTGAYSDLYWKDAGTAGEEKERLMSFWKRLTPDEPLVPPRIFADTDQEKLPAPVRNWCFLSIAVNVSVAGMTTLFLRNAAPIVMAAMASCGPVYFLLFWGDVTSSADRAIDAAERFPLPGQINISTQWAAISACIGTTLMMCAGCVAAWYTFR